MRDEVFILLGTLGACALLILGVLELMWPSRPRGASWMARRDTAAPRRRASQAVELR